MDVALLGLLTGAAAGAVMVRAGACFNSGLRRAAFERAPLVLRVFALAVVIQLPVLVLLIALGLDVSRIGLFPLAQVVGGIVFGAGMALAGGCIAGILWKTGSGSLATAIAVAGFATGELVARGPADSVRKSLDDAVERPGDQTLFALFSLDYAPVALVIGAIVGAVLLRRTRGGLAGGLALAAVSALAWVTASWVDHDYGLGFVGVAKNAEGALTAGDAGRLSFPFYIAIGLAGGAALAASRELRVPDGARAARALVGGVLMGVGGTLAHGCNIGNGLTGIPLLSLGSIWATAWMAVGALVTWRLVLSPRPALRGLERAGPRRVVAAGER